MKTKTQVWLETAASVAVIYCPKVAFEATLLLNSKAYPDWLELVALLSAVSLLWSVFQVRHGYERANFLTMMLFVYSSIALVEAYSVTSPTGETALLWAAAALVFVPIVRLCLQTPEAGWKRVLLRYDSVRYAAVVGLFSILFLGSGGAYQSWNWILSASVIVYTVAMNSLLTAAGVATWTPDGKTAVGWIRWIMAFAVGGSLIGWVVGTSDSVLLALVITVYIGLLLEEPPNVKVLTVELSGVLGSGVATTLHLIFMKTSLVQRLPPIHILALCGYMSFCLYVLFNWFQGKRHFSSLSDLLRKIGRTE